MTEHDPNLTVARRFAAILDACGISHGEVTATGAGAVVTIGCEVRLDPPVDVLTIPLPPGVGGALAQIAREEGWFVDESFVDAGEGEG